MDDKSDPLDGWLPRDVNQQLTPAKEDCYGKLFAYLRSRFSVFLLRLSKLKINFELFCIDAIDLQRYVEKDHYVRIEVRRVAAISAVDSSDNISC
jgi:hypothetical protein